MIVAKPVHFRDKRDPTQIWVAAWDGGYDEGYRFYNDITQKIEGIPGSWKETSSLTPQNRFAGALFVGENGQVNLHKEKEALDLSDRPLARAVKSYQQGIDFPSGQENPTGRFKLALAVPDQVERLKTAIAEAGLDWELVPRNFNHSGKRVSI